MNDKIVDISDARWERAQGQPPEVIAEIGGPIGETAVAICVYGDNLER